ncbi:MAG: tetratricopeptide repeat protein [Bacteroidales bacterium]|nr:tetratricopeptide repeat protein [Bacteroidales bacterium]
MRVHLNLLLLISILFSANVIAENTLSKEQQNIDKQLFNKAETLYKQENFEQALQIYLTLEQKYVSDWQLNYNIGNVYFRLSDFPMSILYYERAARLNPNNKNLQDNIKIANSHLRGEVYPIPEFFVLRWMKSVAAIFVPTVWTVLTIILFVVACGAFCLYFFSQNHKKSTFYLFIFFAILTLFSFGSGIIRTIIANDNNYAIVFDAGAIINDNEAEQQYGKNNKIKLFNGEKVKVIEKEKDFYLIKTLEGHKVKVETNAIQTI